MSPTSCRLFRDDETATWKAEITFSDGGRPTTIDTKTTDRVQAAERAAVVKRQREATRRWRRRRAAAAAGEQAPTGAEVRTPVGRPKTGRRPGRPKKRPSLDHDAIAQRLRMLDAPQLPAPDDPIGPEDPTPARPAPEGPEIPADEAPPLPPPEPVTPEIVDPGAADDEKEMLASLLATGTVAGLMMGVREILTWANPPRRAGMAHPIPQGWIERGVTNKYRKIIGDRQMSDGAAIVFGGLGVALSMAFGSEVESPPAAGDAAKPRSTHEAEGSEGRPMPPAAANPPPPPPAPPRLNGIHKPNRGEAPPPEQSALGRF